MKRITQIFPIILAAALQIMPLVRNLFINPATGNTMAFILRWGIGSAAAVGAVDACSGATNSFTTPTNLTGTVGIRFTNSLVLKSSGSDSGTSTVITSNGVSKVLFASGQTTNFAMPPGLFLKFMDNGTPSGNPVYDAIYGTPTTVGTNSFRVDMSYPGATTISATFTIAILASSGSPPVITNQPASLTNNVGANSTFSVTAGGTAPLKYQWYFNTNTSLLNMTNSSLTLTNIQLTNAGYYRVAITNSAGATNSFNALLTVIQPPVITNNPVSFTNVAGGNATFTVLAGGSAPLAYQWYFNTNTALSDATNTSFPLTGIRASQTGYYQVVITNGGGSITSTPASLVVTNPLPATLTAPANSGGVFQFTFIPVVGLTNSVQTNSILTGGDWAVLTNVPPPATTDPITVSDPFGGSNRFYRVQVSP